MVDTRFVILPNIGTLTKGRCPWISASVAERLYSYVGSIDRADKGILCDIGGVVVEVKHLLA